MTSEKLFATTIVALMLLTVSIAGGRRATKAATEGDSGANLHSAPLSAQHEPAAASELFHNRPQGSQASAGAAETSGDFISPSAPEEAPREALAQSSPSRRPSPFRDSRHSGAVTQGNSPTQSAATRRLSPAQRSASAADTTLKRSAAPQKTPPPIREVGGEPNLAAQLQERQLSSFSDDSAAEDANRVEITRIGGNIGRMARLGGNLGRRATIGGNVGRMAEVVGTEGTIAMLGGNVGRAALIGGNLGAKATMGGARGTSATVHQALPG